MMDETTKYATAIELLNSTFEDLSNCDTCDQEVVALVKAHLGQSSILSKAGKNLADELISLARSRVEEGRR
jgi:hypothetical protein